MPPQHQPELWASGRPRLLLRLGAALLTAWFLVGAWPQGPVECDGVRLAISADHIRENGRSNHDRAYVWEGTSGTYALLMAAQELTGGDAYKTYAWLSTIAGLVFLLFAALIAGQLAGAPWELALIVVLLVFQEAGANLAYPNSNIIAAAALGVGWWVVFRAQTLPAIAAGALFFGLAGWCRADAATMAFAMAAATLRPDMGRQWLVRISVVGVVTGAIVFGGMALMGAEVGVLLETLSKVSAVTVRGTPGAGLLASPQVRSNLAFFSVASVLGTLIGWGLWAKQRNWRPLVASLAGVIPVAMFYVPKVTTPKQLGYLIPFAAASCVYVVVRTAQAQAQTRRRIAWAAIAVVVLGQGLIGLRVHMRSKPWGFYEGLSLATIGPWHPRSGPFSPVSVELGPGTIIPTDDGLRLATGTFFYPWFAHDKKAARAQRMTVLTARVAEMQDGQAAFAGTCDGQWWFGLAANRAGFSYAKELPVSKTMRRGHIWEMQHADGRRIKIYSGWLADYDLDYFRRVGADEGIYVLGSNRERAALLKQVPAAKRICGMSGYSPVGAYDVKLGPRRDSK
ncbi:MAG: hypothetical protein KC502_07700 [Myxococcales bacterium]|nr:hypothetical protein [Myxococcales bacterium]